MSQMPIRSFMANSLQIETLPTRSVDIQPLQNVLSVSTAGKNRYLLHFNSLHSLTQWTAAIRLAMYENATLHEAYTGSLIAGKGKLLNNIKVIMDRTRIKNEDWTRVRFGAGTPWRRCWCVITPPDEKDVQKQQKQLKKKSAYERVQPLKGNIKFYDTKKTKKAWPIATINDAYSAYAIYPQKKSLIDQSTLIKVEGSITIHSDRDITNEGFVFVMPEVHPAVSGFEMMLRYLFPVYDVFALYGRPTRLIADTLDPRSLMFALPQEKRYGYLEILDVAGLIHEKGSSDWTEREWRKRLKDLTSARMTRMTTNGRPRSRASSYRSYRNSLPSRGGGIRYEDGASIKSTPSLRDEAPPMPPPHTSSAPPDASVLQPPLATPDRPKAQHQRSFSEVYPASEPQYRRSQRDRKDYSDSPSRVSYEQSRPSYEASRSGRPSYEQAPPPPMKAFEQAPTPPTHGVPVSLAAQKAQIQDRYAAELESAKDRSSSESERRLGSSGNANGLAVNHDLRPAEPPSHVAAPPAFSHEPGARPQRRPGVSPDMRRANSRLSVTTLQQLKDAGKNSTVGGTAAAAGAAAAWRSNSGSIKSGRNSEDQGQRGVISSTRKTGNTADRSTSVEGMAPVTAAYSNPISAGSRELSTSSSQSGALSPPYYKDKPLMNSYDLLSPQGSISRTVSPLSQASAPSSPLGSPSANSVYVGTGNHAAPPISSSPSYIQKPLPRPMGQSRPSSSRTTTGQSISRKPVPMRTPTSISRSHSPSQPDSTHFGHGSVEPPMPVAKPSLDSLKARYIDEEALAQVLNSDYTSSLTSGGRGGIRDDDVSVYDNESTVSPDYASTRKSTDTRRSQRSVEKPRRGVLKTVGTPEPALPRDVQVGDAHYHPGATPEPQISAAIPLVDFGPTQRFDPAAVSRPNTAPSLSEPNHQRMNSSDWSTPTPSPRGDSPINASPSLSVQPAGKQLDSPERSPSRNLMTPEPQSQETSPLDDNRKSMAWQPGARIGASSPSPRLSLTPEQFVQQRAAASRVTPIYAHGRQKSGSPTPPTTSRQSSGEWANQITKSGPRKLQKRHSSYGNEISSRPQSRAASNLMYSSADYSNNLSAREQEHVARVTGSPLINMAGNKGQNTGSQGGGLVGAIEAREKEKKEMKQGLSGQMVQQAIAQKQHLTQQKRQSSYTIPTQQFTTPQPQYAMPGGYPPSPTQYYAPPNAQQQQSQYYGWNSPGYQQQQQPQLQYQQPQHAHHPQQQQQQQQHWTPPSAGQFVGPRRTSTYEQQPQGYYRNEHSQDQQQHQGSYFGSGR